MNDGRSRRIYLFCVGFRPSNSEMTVHRSAKPYAARPKRMYGTQMNNVKAPLTKHCIPEIKKIHEPIIHTGIKDKRKVLAGALVVNVIRMT